MKRKKYSVSKTLFRVFLAIIGIANLIYFASYFFTKPPHIVYPAFGIEIPPNYQIHGIDVSRYQQIINWEDVKEMQVKNIKIGFAFIKATEGTDRVDPQFRRNWLNAEKENIPKGAYHYFIADKILGDDFDGTIDGTHPNDLGFYRMTQSLLPTIKKLSHKGTEDQSFTKKKNELSLILCKK